MRSKSYPFVMMSLLIIALFGTTVAQAGSPAQRKDAPIRLKAATFTPTRGEAPAVRPELALDGYAEGRSGYYLVQFRGPVEQAWKDQAAALGAEFLEYVPEFTFKVRMNPAQARQVAGLDEVAWVGPFQPAYKLSPTLKRDGSTPYTVRVERGADPARVAAEIAAADAQVLGREGEVLLVAADAAQLDAVARVLDVAWVQNFTLWEKHNEYGAGAIIGANTANTNGYDGSTQIAAVADTGIGGGTAATAHPDIPASRVAAIFSWTGVTDACFSSITNDGAVDVDSGHGTHVAGSVLSDGSASGQGKGSAPAARLVFQAIENFVTTSSLCKNVYGYQDGYYLVGIPADLRQLFQQAYDAGARVHANSWGSNAAGDYTADSAYADNFVWNHKDMAITFSAGNEGIDANANGVIDNDSIGSPATAKNVITIGASENDRQGHYECDTTLSYTSHDATYQSGQTCGSMGGQNLLGAYGQRWSADYPANPIASDPSAGNAQQMAAFSSRGPTDDGRIKPDVVAPGTWILSTYSGEHQEGYGDPVNPKINAYQSDGWGMPVNGGYKYFGGTSMSNPIAAGGATVVRDFYNKAKGINASAALVKATLINSAVDLLDENNDGANDNDFPIPNVHEGWGRIDLAAATDNSAAFVDQATSLSTNGAASYQASPNGGPLKVTLAWSDYPSTETATANLVNDLDLTVTAPNGTVYRGNVFSGGWSATGGSADRANNVENVYIASPAAGAWTVQVKGYNVPSGPQSFALVVDGATLTATPPPPAPAAPSNLTATAVSKTQINLTWTDNASNEDGFAIERCTGSTCTSFIQIGTVGPNVTSVSNTGLTRNTAYGYRVRAFNAGGNSAYSNTARATTPR